MKPGDRFNSWVGCRASEADSEDCVDGLTLGLLVFFLGGAVTALAARFPNRADRLAGIFSAKQIPLNFSNEYMEIFT